MQMVHYSSQSPVTILSLHKILRILSKIVFVTELPEEGRIGKKLSEKIILITTLIDLCRLNRIINAVS